MDYSLEDTLESLKESEMERQKEVENMIHEISNNNMSALDRSNVLESVKKKQQKLCHSLLKQIVKETPKDYPIPKTSDLHVQVLTGLEEEIRNAQELLNKMEANLSRINADISYLESKRKGLERMKEANVEAAEMTATVTYEKEHIVIKRMFKDVKNDLHTVVETLFPGNEDFGDILAGLTRAYAKGGDDVYLDVTPQVLHYIQFLLEADIAMYHRNNKNKVRLTDMV